METIVQILQQQAKTQPDSTAFIFLEEDAVTEQERISYEQLDCRARRVAAHLASLYQSGERVALVQPPGLSFVVGFFGCLYARLIPVPLYPPSGRNPTERISGILENATCSVILTTAQLKVRLQDIPCNKVEIIDPLLDTDCLESNFIQHLPGADDTAFLQYTSGSTGTPKGVIISHGNIIYNTKVVDEAFGIEKNGFGCGWLPPYHDMGLVGLILQTVFSGISTTLMSPGSFLRAPIRWLHVISKYGVTISGGPNFAFDLCVKKFTPDACNGLDLSCWNIAFCGAEPVRAETARQFIKTFEPYGFQSNAFYPCYGMAESTLFVTGGDRNQFHNSIRVDRDKLAEKLIHEVSGKIQSTEIVSCGKPRSNTEIHIVNPETRRIVPENQVGELWVTSGNVGKGYWNNHEKSEAVFNVFTEEGKGPCLRTGDLGCLHQDELYVIGRLKDILIIRGLNYYPQDIEVSAGKAHSALHADRTAVFTVDDRGEQRIVVVAELTRQYVRNLDGSPLVYTIRNTIAEEFELVVFAVILVGPGHLPRTSSGKIRRSRCRDLYLNDELEDLYQWSLFADRPSVIVSSTDRGEETVDHSSVSSHPIPTSPDPRADDLITWLRDYAKRRINSRLMDERRCITPPVVLDFGNKGLFGMTIPTQFGGLGMSEVDTLRVISQLGAIDISLASMVGIHLALGAEPIVHHAKPDLQNHVLPPLAAGRKLAAFALTEPAAGSNPRGMMTTASPDGTGGWRLNGDKSWIGNAAWAGVINVFVRQVDDHGNVQGITGFVLDTDNPGLHIGEEALTMGVRGMVQNNLHLREALVTSEVRLGETGVGFSIANQAMNSGRLGITAMCIGALRYCIQLLHRYASRRIIASGLLLDHAVTLDRLAVMDASATTLDALMNGIAVMRDQGKDVPEFAYLACKIAGPELLWQGVDWTAQALAGRGYTENNDLPRMLRDARLLRIFEGPTETLKMHIGQIGFRQPESLIQFFIDGFKAPRAAENFKRAHAEISNTHHGSFGSGSNSGQRLTFEYGQLVTWSLLEASLEVNGTPDSREWALEWIQNRFNEHLYHMLSDRPLRFDKDRLTERIRNYAIGGVEQHLPGEQLERDTLLCVDTEKTLPSTPCILKSVDLTSDRVSPIPEVTTDTANSNGKTKDLQSWMIKWVSQTLKVDPSNINSEESLIAMGVDSVTAAEFVLALEEECGVQLPMGILWDAPSISKVIEYLEKNGTENKPEDSSTINQDVKAKIKASPPANAFEQIATSKTNETFVNRYSEVKNCGKQSLSSRRKLRFSLYFFGNDSVESVRDKYRLVLEAARQADSLGLEAIWLPERHFHSFGAAFPNPAMLGSAIAETTKRLHIRSGSVVLPLHDPLNVVENWAVLDRLSDGRTGLGLTAGWNPDDFVLDPEAFAKRFTILSERIETAQRLWRGESVCLRNGEGKMVDIKVQPRPLQTELPLWLTCNRRREAFEEAGKIGANVLTGLIAQTPDELAEKIALYRRTREEYRHNPETGTVTMFLHTFIGDNGEAVEAEVRQPLMNYLDASVDLYRRGIKDLDEVNSATHEQIKAYAYERYRRTSTLIGTTDDCRKIAQCFYEQGVDEIACLVDFGLPASRILDSLESLGQLAREFSTTEIRAKNKRDKVQNISKSKTIDSNETLPWVVNELPRPEASLRLFCIPYAGGDASVFQNMCMQFPDTVEVIALNAPQKIDHMESLLSILTPTIEPFLDRPYAFYGHSVGALIAFELIHRFRVLQILEPLHLFVGAQRAPHLPFPFSAYDDLFTPEGLTFLEQLVTPKVFSRMKSKNLDMLRRILTPIEPGIRIQNDNYKFQQGVPLHCPITAFYGTQDCLLEPSQVDAWRIHTNAEFDITAIEGGHLFIQEQTPKIIEQMTLTLNNSYCRC